MNTNRSWLRRIIFKHNQGNGLIWTNSVRHFLLKYDITCRLKVASTQLWNLFTFEIAHFLPRCFLSCQFTYFDHNYLHNDNYETWTYIEIYPYMHTTLHLSFTRGYNIYPLSHTHNNSCFKCNVFQQFCPWTY